MINEKMKGEMSISWGLDK